VSVLDTFRFIAGHPLTRDRKAQAFGRWLQWQISSRAWPHPAVVPFVNDTRLLVRSGMTGATGNIYCGLHEFEDMAFVLHFLRPGDLFADVGANVGTYSVLAASTGAKVVSFEPIPATFESLLDNLHLNRLLAQVDARNLAIGRSEGHIQMVADQDTTNQVLPSGGIYAGETVNVPQATLDTALRESGAPRVIKIDVEGFESDVLAGAEGVLSDEALQAVVMELNGSGRRYGHDDEDLHQSMRSRGFGSFRYAPCERRLIDLEGRRSLQGNTLYLRSPESAQAMVAGASPFRVLGRSV
jgi:FkbM family methyltransferase